MSLILREALLLGALGGVLGILVGLGLFALMKLEPTTSQMISAAWTLPMFARTLGIALALGAVGGLYPAWRATRLPPVEALRYE